MKIKLYTTHCPKCKILEKKLNAKNIPYEIIEDLNIMLEKGMKSAPYLEVDGVLYDFVDGNKWINEFKGNEG